MYRASDGINSTAVHVPDMGSPDNLGERILESVAWVTSQATDVSMDREAIAKLVDELTDETLKRLYFLPHFDQDLHFIDLADPHLTAQYLMVLDSLNFCFWPHPTLEYEHIAQGLKKSVLQDPASISAESLMQMESSQLRTLIDWQDDLPLADERARLLRELGHTLSSKFEGQAANLIEMANQSAERLASLVISLLPGFQDHAIYRGRQIFFYKRAQIFVADVYGAFKGTGLGQFNDIHKLTMFADYRVPVVLKESGILKYSHRLGQLVSERKEIIAGSPEEVEIRASTIMAVEYIKEELSHRSKKNPPPSVHIDWWLWEWGEAHRDQHPPHHRTLTIFY